MGTRAVNTFFHRLNFLFDSGSLVITKIERKKKKRFELVRSRDPRELYIYPSRERSRLSNNRSDEFGDQFCQTHNRVFIFFFFHFFIRVPSRTNDHCSVWISVKVYHLVRKKVLRFCNPESSIALVSGIELHQAVQSSTKVSKILLFHWYVARVIENESATTPVVWISKKTFCFQHLVFFVAILKILLIIAWKLRSVQLPNPIGEHKVFAFIIIWIHA